MSYKSLNDATPEEWDKAAKAVGWGSTIEKLKKTSPGEIIPVTEEELKAITRGKIKATEKQVGGNHYKKFKIQPAEFCYVNDIPYLEATAIKYLCRWKDKGGIQDLEKAKHFIDLLIEFQNANH